MPGVPIQIEIVLADGHKLIRRGLHSLIDNESNLNSVADLTRYVVSEGLVSQEY